MHFQIKDDVIEALEFGKDVTLWCLSRAFQSTAKPVDPLSQELLKENPMAKTPKQNRKTFEQKFIMKEYGFYYIAGENMRKRILDFSTFKKYCKEANITSQEKTLTAWYEEITK